MYNKFYIFIIVQNSFSQINNRDSYIIFINYAKIRKNSLIIMYLSSLWCLITFWIVNLWNGECIINFIKNDASIWYFRNSCDCDWIKFESIWKYTTINIITLSQKKIPFFWKIIIFNGYIRNFIAYKRLLSKFSHTFRHWRSCLCIINLLRSFAKCKKYYK